jgi:hypothetical protein
VREQGRIRLDLFFKLFNFFPKGREFVALLTPAGESDCNALLTLNCQLLPPTLEISDKTSRESGEILEYHLTAV